MNKNIFTFLMVGMAACAVSTSCSKDDGDGDSGAPGAPAGALVSGNEAVDAAVRGLRISAVGPYRYEYDESGALQGIYDSDSDLKVTVSGNVIHIQEEWEGNEVLTATYNIVNNHIVSVSETWYDSDGEEPSLDGTEKFSYNALGQLASREMSWTSDGKTSSEKSVFIYSPDNRLLSIESTGTEWDEDEEEWDTYKEKITFEYETTYPNLFYQYAHDMAATICADDYGEVLACVGLYGKASSFLPSGCVYDDDEDGKYYHESWDYTFNEDGTLKSSTDGYYTVCNYSYSNVGTRAAMEETVPGAERRTLASPLLRKHHGRRHVKFVK